MIEKPVLGLTITLVKLGMSSKVKECAKYSDTKYDPFMTRKYQLRIFPPFFY